MRKSELWENQEGKTKERWGYWKKIWKWEWGHQVSIPLMRDSCAVFVLFFLLNLFLTAQNINGFYFFRSGWCWPIRALPISILLLSVLCNGVLFKGFLLCVVLFCFSSQFVFDRQNILDVGLCLYSMNILVIKYPYTEKNWGKKKLGKLCIWSLSFISYFNFVYNLSIVLI